MEMIVTNQDKKQEFYEKFVKDYFHCCGSLLDCKDESDPDWDPRDSVWAWHEKEVAEANFRGYIKAVKDVEDLIAANIVSNDEALPIALGDILNYMKKNPDLGIQPKQESDLDNKD